MDLVDVDYKWCLRRNEWCQLSESCHQIRAGLYKETFDVLGVTVKYCTNLWDKSRFSETPVWKKPNC